MWRIELCLYDFELTIERSIQAARVAGRGAPGVEQARVGSAGERTTLGAEEGVLAPEPDFTGLPRRQRVVGSTSTLSFAW